MSVKNWYYQIKAREGRDGFADDVEYKSDIFDSFEKCFVSYINFKPSKRWNNLRHIQSENIIYNNTYITKANDGMLYYDDPEIELGITEFEFDNLIDKINRK
jgi:hypothetical protein